MPLGLKSLSRTLHARKERISDGLGLITPEDIGKGLISCKRNLVLKNKVDGARINLLQILSTCAMHTRQEDAMPRMYRTTLAFMHVCHKKAYYPTFNPPLLCVRTYV